MISNSVRISLHQVNMAKQIKHTEMSKKGKGQHVSTKEWESPACPSRYNGSMSGL